MEVLGLSLAILGIFVLWLPYHLLYGHKRGHTFDDFWGTLFVTIVCIGCPIIWIIFLATGIEGMFKPKSKLVRDSGISPRFPDRATMLKAEGKNWL